MFRCLVGLAHSSCDHLVGDHSNSTVVDGFAAALHEAIADNRPAKAQPSSSESSGTGAVAEGKQEDAASLILRLLLRASIHPGPNFAHLLLGFDIADGVQGVAVNHLQRKQPLREHFH